MAINLLTGTNVVVIGGDKRQLEVIGILLEQGAEVRLIGYRDTELPPPLRSAVKAGLDAEVLSGADAVILPVAGIRNDGTTESAFSSEHLVLTESLFAAIPGHATIFTGIASSYLRIMCTQYALTLAEIFERDDVAIYNSIPTAEGAVMIAIQQTDITLHGSVCMVLGLGRVGATLAKTLKALGAQVTVGVNRPDVYARAYELGLQPFYTTELQQRVQSADILFNTVPAPMVTQEVLSRMPARTLIIDLASHPGGTDFQAAEQLGLTAIPALGLPGLVAPRTAGRIIGRAVLEQLSGGPLQ